MARKQQRTKLKPFDIKIWIRMDELRAKGQMKRALKQRNELVEGNRPLAVRIAHDFHQRLARNCDLQDLIQCACVGLTNAVWKFNPRASKTYKLEDFDPSKGAFVGYAGRYILAELWKHSRKDRVMFKPPHEEVAIRFKEAYRAFIKEHEREPTADELELPPTMSVARVARACEPNPGLNYIEDDAPWAFSLPDTSLNPEEDLLLRERENSRLDLLRQLPEDQCQAVIGFVIEERKYSDIGREMGISGLQVKQLVADGLAALKEKMSP